MITLELLQKFCSGDESRKAIMSPFSQDAWTYATDGRLMLRVPRFAEAPEREDAPKNIDKHIFSNNPISNLWQPIPDLPPLLTEEPCRHCKGSGECECKCGNIHDCEHCEGSGTVPLAAQRIQIGVNYVSHVYLWKLKELPDVQVCPSAKDNNSPIGIRFDGGGEGLLMGMRE